MPSGVLKEITAEDRSYYMASDIMALLGISKSKAYDVIRTMRKECIDAGKLTKAYPAGRIRKRSVLKMKRKSTESNSLIRLPGALRTTSRQKPQRKFLREHGPRRRTNMEKLLMPM